jgi:predicted double-glycine peptidase
MKYFNAKTLISVYVVIFFILVTLFLISQKKVIDSPIRSAADRIKEFIPSMVPSPTLSLNIPQSYTIPQRLHVYQTFNNCGPATLSMALSYWGVDISQAELGNILRPYQVVGGDNDDKSVTLAEVARQAEEYGLYSYLRPNGTPEKLEQLVSQGIPVVARTWTKVNEDIGHYRVIRGYNKSTQTIIQDDSLQGENLSYSYRDFNAIWQPFNYEYLVIVDDSKKEVVEAILGEELDEATAWKNALVRIEHEIGENPDNWHLTFAKSRIYYYLGEYEKSVEEFEKVENRLSFRTLWYQIEPILSYFELKNYDRVFQITDRILNNQNRAFSELYYLRGQIYLNQGSVDAARSEFESALLYKHNYQPAQEALNTL